MVRAIKQLEYKLYYRAVICSCIKAKGENVSLFCGAVMHTTAN